MNCHIRIYRCLPDLRSGVVLKSIEVLKKERKKERRKERIKERKADIKKDKKERKKVRKSQ